jgi:hypothetical protein
LTSRIPYLDEHGIELDYDRAKQLEPTREDAFIRVRVRGRDRYRGRYVITLDLLEALYIHNEELRRQAEELGRDISFIRDIRSLIVYGETLARGYKQCIEESHDRVLSLRRAHLRPGPAAFADLSGLRDHCNRCLPDYREAVRLFKECEYPTSRIKAVMPKLLPGVVDCLDWKSLPDAIHRRTRKQRWSFGLSERRGTFNTNKCAFELALEQAARACGASAFAYRISTLRVIYYRQKNISK